MKNYQAGDSNDLAEFIIDYKNHKKPKVKILDPETRFKIKDKDLNFKPPILVGLIFVAITISFVITNEIRLNVILFVYLLFLMFYLLQILLTPIKKKLTKFWQFITNDFFSVKKFMIVKDINTKEWRLPYGFKNIKFDCNLYGDYAKLIKKVWIKPKDYFWIRRKKKERQTEDWEILFSFKKTPRIGRMEILWI